MSNSARAPHASGSEILELTALQSCLIQTPLPKDKVSCLEAKSSGLGTAGLPSVSGVQVRTNVSLAVVSN